jgi:hypothetical protein
MSTKNLARTVIEGGRANGNKFLRRSSHRVERARLRTFLAHGRADSEVWDALDPEPRPTVYKEFDDKLAPCWRWLRANVGRSWDEVRASIAATFDTRTLAGRHIVYDHMLKEVVDCFDASMSTWPWFFQRFIIDAQGILREADRRRRKPLKRRADAPTQVEVDAWCGGRLVGRRGTKLYWFVRVWSRVKHPGAPPQPPRYRQDRELAADDVAFYSRLSRRVQCFIGWRR